MPQVNTGLSILMVGVVGGIIYTLATHPDGVKAWFDGLNSLYSSAARSTQGAA